MVDLKEKVAGILAKLEGGLPEGATKYHTQAQARAQKRTAYRAELKQDKKGAYTLVPEKVVSKEST